MEPKNQVLGRQFKVQTLTAVLLLALAALATIVLYDANRPAESNRSTTELLLPAATPTCDECEVTATLMSAQVTAVAAIRGTPEDRPVVRAVMFWKVGCHHCEMTLSVILPPLQEYYGSQFELLLVQVISMEDVEAFFRMAASFGIEQNVAGVPFLVVGERVLIGQQVISADLPGLIEAGLALGGVDLPANQVLAEILAARAPVPTFALPAGRTGTPARQEPVAEVAAAAIEPLSDASPESMEGFGLGVVVLGLLTVSLAYSLPAAIGTRLPVARRVWVDGTLPLLAVTGIGVAIYLAHAKITSSEVVCRLVSGCDVVQASPYALLFGWLPLGVAGALGYLLILTAWWVARRGGTRIQGPASLAAFGMAVFGVLFSIYLTSLELYLIRAVCQWCLTSAILMALLLPLTLPNLRRWLDPGPAR
ncbi:MAG: hypothetical protein JXB85_02015 [Anaerolineales bacterium]|nr:hypothetical protein [Anaerolineales bacterium]